MVSEVSRMQTRCGQVRDSCREGVMSAGGFNCVMPGAVCCGVGDATPAKTWRNSDTRRSG